MTTHTITLARHTAQVVGLMGVLVLGTWDSYGTEQLLLRHGPEWEGLAIDATFHNTPSDEGVTMLVDADGLVPVPPEACIRPSKYATITFRGVQDGVQRISCNLPYMVLDHAQVPGANSTATPSENAQALTQMQDLRDGAVDAKNMQKPRGMMLPTAQPLLPRARKTPLPASLPPKRHRARQRRQKPVQKRHKRPLHPAPAVQVHSQALRRHRQRRQNPAPQQQKHRRRRRKNLPKRQPLARQIWTVP